jgi:hypothetical protein
VNRIAVRAALLAAFTFIVVYVALAWLGALGPGPDASAAPTGRPAAPSPATGSQPAPTDGTSAGPVAVLVGAGDIGDCSTTEDEATAALLETIEGTVFTLGDNVYENGSTGEFERCYTTSWGRPSIRDRTRPVPGNHDYNTRDARGYFGWFGAAAGDPARGYYAYDVGAWRVYALNSNCGQVGGCDAGSPQEQWLRADLAANPRACAIGMWHHPRFSSGEHGDNAVTQALWAALYDANAELVLAGHDHDYERFAPQTATGALDDARGLIEVVVGTGGRSLRGFGTPRDNSLVRNADTWGVLRLSLSPGAYAFEFVPASGGGFTDSGSGHCH